MIHLMPGQLPWFVVGPGIGLLIVGLYAVANRPLGMSGAYFQTLELARHGRAAEPWRAWYFGGVLAGGALIAILRGGPALGLSDGTLGTALPLAALVPVLFGAGILSGYGARWMGGCTSGHGLCGTSALSPASFVATGTFVGTAVAVTALLHLVTGGTL